MMEFLSNLWDLVMSIWYLIVFFFENPTALLALFFVIIFIGGLFKRYGFRTDTNKD